MSDEGGRRPQQPIASSARGLVLIVVAVVIGFVLIGTGLDTDGGGGGGPAALPSGADQTTTTAPDATTSTTAPPLPVEQVRVLVANGSTTSGVARRFTDELNALNYATLEPTNADDTVQATIVFHAEGFEREAAAVATALGAPGESVQPLPVPSPVPVPDGQTAPNVIVVIGPDLAGG